MDWTYSSSMNKSRRIDMSLDEIIEVDGIVLPFKYRYSNRSRGSRPFRGFQSRRPYRGSNYRGNNFRSGYSYRGYYRGNRYLHGNTFASARGLFQPRHFNYHGASNRRRPYGSRPPRFPTCGFRGPRTVNSFRGHHFSGHNQRQQEPSTAVLEVSNLVKETSENDIKSLFGSFGILTQCQLQTDDKGNCLGKAQVTFKNRADGIEALNRLNGVPFDGDPMQIVLLDQPSSTTFNDNSNAQPGSSRDWQPNLDGPPIRLFAKPPSIASNLSKMDCSPNHEIPNAEDLDRDLDEWRMQVDPIFDLPILDPDLDVDLGC